jgi:hypothetical protein
MKFRVELAWKDGEAEDAPSIYLAADGSVILQGRILRPEEREKLQLPADCGLISVDKNLIRAIKEML